MRVVSVVVVFAVALATTAAAAHLQPLGHQPMGVFAWAQSAATVVSTGARTDGVRGISLAMPQRWSLANGDDAPAPLNVLPPAAVAWSDAGTSDAMPPLTFFTSVVATANASAENAVTQSFAFHVGNGYTCNNAPGLAVAPRGLSLDISDASVDAVADAMRKATTVAQQCGDASLHAFIAEDERAIDVVRYEVLDAPDGEELSALDEHVLVRGFAYSDRGFTLPDSWDVVCTADSPDDPADGEGPQIARGPVVNGEYMAWGKLHDPTGPRWRNVYCRACLRDACSSTRGPLFGPVSLLTSAPADSTVVDTYVFSPPRIDVRCCLDGVYEGQEAFWAARLVNELNCPSECPESAGECVCPSATATKKKRGDDAVVKRAGHVATQIDVTHLPNARDFAVASLHSDYVEVEVRTMAKDATESTVAHTSAQLFADEIAAVGDVTKLRVTIEWQTLGYAVLLSNEDGGAWLQMLGEQAQIVAALRAVPAGSNPGVVGVHAALAVNSEPRGNVAVAQVTSDGSVTETWITAYDADANQRASNAVLETATTGVSALALAYNSGPDSVVVAHIDGGSVVAYRVRIVEGLAELIGTIDTGVSDATEVALAAAGDGGAVAWVSASGSASLRYFSSPAFRIEEPVGTELSPRDALTLKQVCRGTFAVENHASSSVSFAYGFSPQGLDRHMATLDALSTWLSTGHGGKKMILWAWANNEWSHIEEEVNRDHGAPCLELAAPCRGRYVLRNPTAYTLDYTYFVDGPGGRTDAALTLQPDASVTVASEGAFGRNEVLVAFTLGEQQEVRRRGGAQACDSINRDFWIRNTLEIYTPAGATKK